MCGISGVFHFQSKGAVSQDLLKSMSDTMEHRGPDDSGIYVSKDAKLGFGFRRLSIIDLSHAGHQPMTNETGTMWVMLNGEIYNFQDLRETLEMQGHRFRSKTDTEVILHGYEEKGLESVNNWNGMFAVALWDNTKKRLWLVRDRLGIKPLYYTVQNGTIIFASEIKAILAHPSVKKKLNEEAFYHYLTFSCCPAPLTLFEGIKKLPAGHFLTIDENGVKETQYWDAIPKSVPVSSGTAPKDERYFSDSVKDLLKDSVSGQMVSDVPFGVFLSGGIDSSTNVALMTAARGAPVDSFSVNFEELPQYDEFSWAQKVSQEFESKQHGITVGPEELISFLPKLAEAADDPNGDPVCFPLYYVSKLIRDSGVIMAQVGEGADELFAGYNQYLLVVNFWKHWWKKLAKLPKNARGLISRLADLSKNPAYELHRENLRRLACAEEFFWGGAIAFTEHSKRNILSENMRLRTQSFSSFDVIKPHYEKFDKDAMGADFLTRMTYLELKIRLPELLLMRVDKITMANSIESRVPYLDHRLVELAMQIPMDLKIKNSVSKYILKQAVRGVIPDAIIDRKKQGFTAPIAHWLRNDLKKELPQIIWQSKIWNADLLNKPAIEKLIKDHCEGRADLSFKIWNIITLCLWWDKWMA